MMGDILQEYGRPAQPVVVFIIVTLSFMNSVLQVVNLASNLSFGKICGCGGAAHGLEKSSICALM
jgi:hypothetical protein